MILREMEIMKLKKRLFALLLTALMLVTMVPAVSFAAGETYTLKYNNGDPDTTAPYDSPVMLPIPTRAGYTFTGWYVEDAFGAYVEEVDTTTTYYKIEKGPEQPTTTPNFSSGNEYYTKVEYFEPVKNSAGTGYVNLTTSISVKDRDVKEAVSSVGVYAPLVADDDALYVYYSAVTTATSLVEGKTFYFNINGISEWNGYPGVTDKTVYVPIVSYSTSMTVPSTNYFASDLIASNMYPTIPAKRGYDAVYRKVSTHTTVDSSTYTTGTTVYYEPNTRTPISQAEYGTLPEDQRDMISKDTPTGVFRKATASDSSATHYKLVTMAEGAFTYYAGWTNDSTVPTCTLKDGNGTVYGTFAYDPTSPVTLPKPAKAGSAFGGWIDSSSNVVTITPGSGENVIYTATWTFADYITEWTIKKAYNRTFDAPADGITTQGVFAETINYTITAVGSENRAVGKTAIPTIAPVSIPVGSGSDQATITLPDFTAEDYGIGDYWYEVVETAGTTAGVTYDTNVYYLHLVVTDEDGTGGDNVGVSNIVLHKTVTDTTKKAVPGTTGIYVDLGDPNDPSPNTTKALGFTNVYNSGELSVTKDVTGNMGDPEKYFKVTVTFDAGTKTVSGRISYTGGFADETGATPYTTTAPGVIDADWTGSSSVVVYLKDDATVTFTNIPEGVTYTIVEEDYSADGYEATFSIDSNADADGDTVADDKSSVTGTIADDADAVTITNKKDVAVDVGVILEDMPYLLIVGVCVAALVLVVLKRRKHSAD